MELHHRVLTYVDRPDVLRPCIDRLLASDSVAVDTEANSLYAYRERLCLIQEETTDREPQIICSMGLFA